MEENIKILHLENCTARIHYSEQTEEEREKQIDRLKRATAEFLQQAEAELMRKMEDLHEEKSADIHQC